MYFKTKLIKTNKNKINSICLFDIKKHDNLPDIFLLYKKNIEYGYLYIDSIKNSKIINFLYNSQKKIVCYYDEIIDFWYPCF